MKQLRTTIRKILLESQPIPELTPEERQVHFDKIADLICSEDISSIHQALELAKGMGYIRKLRYGENTHYDSRTHSWTFFIFWRDLLTTLEDRTKMTNLFRKPRGEGLIFKSPLRDGSPCSIVLTELPPYE